MTPNTLLYAVSNTVTEQLSARMKIMLKLHLKRYKVYNPAEKQLYLSSVSGGIFFFFFSFYFFFWRGLAGVHKNQEYSRFYLSEFFCDFFYQISSDLSSLFVQILWLRLLSLPSHSSLLNEL